MYQWPGKVYFADTDAAGVVHHSQYLRWLEAARIDYFDHIGFPYENLQAQKVGFVPCKIQANYHHPLRFADRFQVYVQLSQLKRASLTLHQPLYKEKKLIYEASITFACMNEADWRIIAIPKDIQRALRSTETA